MTKIWLGHLSRRATKPAIRNLFLEHGLVPSDIDVKRGYAFVYCPDQETADIAIDTFNSLSFLGSMMQVEPSVSKKGNSNSTATNSTTTPTTKEDGGSRTNRVSLQNFPKYVKKEEVQSFCEKIGPVKRCDPVGEDEGTFTVIFESPDHAADAVKRLQGQDYHGQKLEATPLVTRLTERDVKKPRNNTMFRINQRRKDEYPLRVLVKSDYIGAVIGSKGLTIADITQKCKAGVDVLRQSKEEKIRMPETPIFIYGQPENASQACKEILTIVEKESKEEGVHLKMLVEDKYCGSIIGRKGQNIKSVRETTNTKINISQQHPHPMYRGHPHYPLNWDRIISIRGPLESVALAEKDISAKVRTVIQNEKRNQEFTPQFQHHVLPPVMPCIPHHIYSYPGQMMGGYNMPMFGPYPGSIQNGHPGMHSPPPQHMEDEEDESYILVTDGAASMLIGPKGANIRALKEKSKASYIHIDPEKGTHKEPNPARNLDEVPIPKDPKLRVVTIRGNLDSQLRAHLEIYRMLRAENFAGSREVELTCILKVPKDCVGKIIGKKGHNVKDIQKVSGAVVKTPEGGGDYPTLQDQVWIEITGSYTATQAAICRIKDKVRPKPSSPSGGGGGPGPGGNFYQGPPYHPLPPPLPGQRPRPNSAGPYENGRK